VRRSKATFLAIMLLAIALLVFPAVVQAETVERVSVDANVSDGDGANANGASETSSISADGRYVAFGSSASDLVADDTNEAGDIFVYDRMFGTTELVSLSDSGAQGLDVSSQPSISADGRWVAFQSAAGNLVDGDMNELIDIFVYDLVDKNVTRMSVRSDGTQAFGGDSTVASVASDDERVYVAYQSGATNLVAVDTNNRQDVFVSYFWKTDLARNITTQRVSVRSGGAQATGGGSTNASISGDGTYVAYQSNATNLVAGDTNGSTDVFVTDWDKASAADIVTKRASVRDDGLQIGADSRDPSISADGTYVAYESQGMDGNSYWDVFVTDWNQTNATDIETEKVSVSSAEVGGNDDSQNPSISADGRYVAFQSAARNLLGAGVDTNANTDVYVRDLVAGTTSRISTDFYGVQSTGGNSGAPAITPSVGTVVPQVSFWSGADNLVPGDDGNFRDVFVGTTDTTPTITSISPASGTTAGGTDVYIIGTNFVGLTGASAVTFDGLGALSYNHISTMKVIATTPAHAPGTVQTAVTAAGGTTADTAVDDYTYVAPVVPAAVKKTAGSKRYEQTDPLFKFSGQWDTGSEDFLSAGSHGYSVDKEASVTLTFKGTRLDWIAEMGPLMGQAMVSIDGQEPVLVDLFSEDALFQQMVWSTGNLDYGTHVVKIYFPTTSASDESKAINIDAVDVMGTLLETT
jgi:hypothetical protein